MINETLNNSSEFIDRLKNGDRAAFAEMVEQFSDTIYRTALRFTSDSQDAEDVLQETFIKALHGLPNFEGRSSLSTWLYRIAVNESLMLLRKRKPERLPAEENREEEDELDESDLVLADFCCLPEDELLSSEARSFLDRTIQVLPETLRSVFILRDLDGLSIKETAEALDLSETNVKTRLLRARLRLRQDLAKYFGDRLVELKKHE